MKSDHIFTVIAAVFIAVSALPTQAAETASEKNGAVKETTYELLFFMNPHGRPCQYQDMILGEIGDAVNRIAPVKYYKTTNRADYPTFREYGVRGLPMLVVVDRTGKTVKRFSPGVQSKETILSALETLKL